jgi:bla regulator protein blaR1
VFSAALPLAALTAAASLAVLFIGLLRVPLRRAVGARAAYWLWLMVPASAIAVLFPARAHLIQIPVSAAPKTVAEVVVSSAFVAPAAPLTIDYSLLGWTIWAAGAGFMLAGAIRRQRAFVRSLGALEPLPNGAYRSTQVSEPMLVGAWRPRIILPADFDSRYSAEERALVLAHERTHLERGDATHNAFATLWLCLCWFNPLMYWALARFRFDQELACDAQVLSATGTARRCYADALLKTQLSAPPVMLVPAGCHWPSNHPLKERIATLKQPLPGALRRLTGVLLALALCATGSYTVWAMQPSFAAAGDSVQAMRSARVIPAIAIATLTMPIEPEIAPLQAAIGKQHSGAGGGCPIAAARAAAKAALAAKAAQQAPVSL